MRYPARIQQIFAMMRRRVRAKYVRAQAEPRHEPPEIKDDPEFWIVQTKLWRSEWAPNSTSASFRGESLNEADRQLPFAGHEKAVATHVDDPVGGLLSV